MNHRLSRALGTIALVATLALSAAACGSSSSPSDTKQDVAATTDGAKAAKAFLNKYTGNPTSIGLDIPLKAKPDAGKSIVYLLTPPAVSQRSAMANKEAAEALGWSYSNVDAGLTPATAVSAFQAAIAKKPDVIMYGGYPAAVFAKQIQQAKAAGITVVSNATGDKKVDGVLADLAGADTEALYGKLAAAYFVAHAGDKGEAAVFNVSALPILTLFSNSFVDAVKEWCPTCKTEIVDQQLTDFGTKAPSNVVSHLQRNPSTKWTVFSNGDLAQGVSAALKTAGLTDINILGEVPTAANLANVESGSETAWVGYPVDILAWRMVDTLARHFESSDIEAALAVPLPLQLITKDNVAGIVTDKTGYYTAVDGFQGQFEKLWQVN